MNEFQYNLFIFIKLILCRNSREFPGSREMQIFFPLSWESEKLISRSTLIFTRIFRQFRPLIESFHLNYRIYLTELLDLSLKLKKKGKKIQYDKFNWLFLVMLAKILTYHSTVGQRCWLFRHASEHFQMSVQLIVAF